MKKLLFDTTIWVDFFRGNENEKSQLLKYYLENDGPILICPPIYQEILQGANNLEQANKIITLLDALVMLNIDSYLGAKEAALIYLNCRKNGITIRKPYDCLIAYYSIFYNIELVHNDNDFDLISIKYPLKIYS